MPPKLSPPEEDSQDYWKALRRRLLPLIAEFGITRVTSTTRLDRIGVPTASAVRPWTRDVIWVYSGKGLSQDEATVKAIMEAIERVYSLWPEDSQCLRTASVADMERGSYLEPSSVTTLLRDFSPERPMLWTRGQRLSDDADIWLPAELVYGGNMPEWALPYTVYATGSSNGLGAGLDMEQALLHALREVIERDVVSCAELQASHAAAAVLATVAERFGISLSAQLTAMPDRDDMAADVMLDSVPSQCKEIIDRFNNAGLDIYIKAIPNDFGLYSFACACQEHLNWDSVIAAVGHCAHDQPEAALRGALLELAQTRATDFQGARDDRAEPEKQRVQATLKDHWLTSKSASSYRFPNASGAPWDRVAYVKALEGAGLTGASYHRFSAACGVQVVRVIVPEAETWHAVAGRTRIGARMKRRFAL